MKQGARGQVYTVDGVDQAGRGIQKHPLVLVRLQQNVHLQRQYVAQLPWWRHPLLGCVMSIPLVGLCLLIPFAEQYITGRSAPLFFGAPFFLVTVLVALLWGGGAAIFSILVGAIALDYFFLSPTYTFMVGDWRDLVPLLPYLLAELFVALITVQREGARRRALFAEQEMQARADELERANNDLEKSNQLKDIFFSRASHELKTPLTAIRGQTQIAQKRLMKVAMSSPDLEVVRNSLEKIEGQTQRLHALVDDLLDLGMLSVGKMQLNMKRCDLVEICHEIVEEQRTLSGRSIDFAVPAPHLKAHVDGERLGQVMTNLVTNAIKYSTDGTTIQVHMLQQDKTVQIQVHNEGQAIPSEQQQNIFEPFYRASNAYNSAKQGWGLGLAICKDIIERHDGRIWVESEEGLGTTFFVELPVK